MKSCVPFSASTAAHCEMEEGFEVVETRGHIVDGAVAHFQVAIKVGFRVN